MSPKPSVTLAIRPRRSGTSTDWIAPPQVMIETDMWTLVSVYLSIAVPSARVPKLDLVTLIPRGAAPAGGAIATASTVPPPAATIAANRFVRLNHCMGPPSRVDVVLDRFELEAGEPREHAPRLRLVSGVEDLVMRAAEAQPAVQARPDPGVGAEEPVRHLQRRQLAGVEDLALADQQPEAPAAERHEGRQGRGARPVLEQERRRIPEAADPERPL